MNEVDPQTVIDLQRKRISDLEWQLTLYQAAELEQKKAAAAAPPEKDDANGESKG